MSEFEEVEYYVLEELDDQRRLERRSWHTIFDRQLHREGGPAVQEFDPETGSLISEIWIDIFNQGRHRDRNLPAETTVDPSTGVVIHEVYYRHGRLHRDDGGPAKVHRNEKNGVDTYHAYFTEGYLHRGGDLPAVIEFDAETGRVVREEYYRNDKLHRDGGPALVEYDELGRVKSTLKQYAQHGQTNGSSTKPTP